MAAAMFAAATGEHGGEMPDSARHAAGHQRADQELGR